MKRKFTKLIAAFALLVFMTPSMAGWGQTRSEADLYYTGSTTFTWEENTNYASQLNLTTSDWSVTGQKNDASIMTACNKDGSVRLYPKSGNGSSITVTNLNNATIESISFTMQQNTPTVKVDGTIIEPDTEGVYTINSSSFVVINGIDATSGNQVQIKSIAIVYTGGTAPTTYTVTFNAGDGTFVGNEDFPNESNEVTAGTYSLPNATRENYSLVWSDGTDTYEAGDDYEVTEDVDFTAQWTENTTPGGDEQWVLTNLADLTTNDVFVIVGNNGSNYAMSNNNGTGSAPSAVAVTVADNAITSNVANTIQWTISGNATDGYTFYPNGSSSIWLYCTNTNNGVRVGTNNSKTFKVDSNSGYLKHDGTSRFVGIYNSSDWRCYTSAGGNIADQSFAFYKKVTGGVIPPSITAEDVNIPYDATSGSITYTITNGVEGGAVTSAEVTASNPENWLTVNGSNPYASPISLSCAANATATEKTATVTLTYTYNRETVTETVNVTQAANPNATMTIAEVRAQGTGNVVTTGIVTSCVGTTGYIQDATAAICVYGSELTVGDEIRVSGTLTTYKGLLEIANNLEVTVLSSGNTINPELMTIAQINTSTNQGWYVRIQEATVQVIDNNNNYTIAQGENTITLHGELGVEVAVNDIISLNGNIGCYNTVQIVNPQNVEVQAAPVVPTIAVTPDVVEVDAEEHDGTLGLTYENLTIAEMDDFAIQYYDVTGAELNGDDVPDWIEVLVATQDPQIGEGYVVSYIMFENESEEARTAYFKVFAAGVEDYVYSNLVTITQAAPVVDYAVLPFEWEGGERSVFEALNGTSTHGVGDYTNAQQGVYKMKLDGTGDYIQVKTDSQPGKVTIGVKMVGGATTSTITVQGSADGETFTSIEALTISGAQNDELTLETNNAFGANDRYVRMLFTKGSNVGVGPISIAKVSTDPYITLLSHSSIYVPESPYQMEFTYSASGGLIDQVVYGNFDVDLTAASFEIQFCDAEGNAVDVIPDWIIGETPKVVLNTSENKLYLEVSVAMNTVADPRTAYFKVGASNDGPMVYSDVVTVNQTGYVPAIDVNPAEVAVPNEGGEGQLAVTYNPFTFSANPIYNVWWCDAYGNSVAFDAYPWLSASFGETRNVLVWQVTTANESEEARTAYLKVEAYDDFIGMVYSNLVTITQAPQTVTYSLATEIVSGKHYIITSGTDGSVKAMGNQNTNNRAAVSVTATDGVIPETEGVYEVVIIGPDVEGYYTLYDVTNEKYLYAAGSSTTTNYLKTQDDINDRARWSITVNQDGTATIYAITTVNISKYIRYNNNSTIFSCYASATNQNNIYLFAKDNEPTVSYEKEIASYGTSLNGGYYLIASPVGQVTPSESNEFLTNDYDLYAFDQSEDAEWRNYEAGSFNLISGRGYLYANNGENVKLTFEGYPYVGNGQVMLAYDGDAEFAGWNLIGNPFGKKATLNMPYYSLNEEGSALNTFLEESDVEEMEGVFVKATGAGQSVKFTPASNQANSVSQLNIKVTRNRSAVLDNAIVRFDNGAMLDKFQLNPNSTKVYFTEGNHDYAIVASEAQGEMPVNFKAENNGTYTLSVNAENVEMNYLHLIDNMTGADVDLLATPSYTFEANTTDYASRFRLVFSANSVASEGACEPGFAYFNGSNWTISNMGEATLQVVDVMGRVLSSETLSGNAEVNINQPAGVYMLRLLNENNVRVQKIVVR